MAEKLTPAGLVVGLILDEDKAEAPAQEAPKAPGRGRKARAAEETKAE